VSQVVARYWLASRSEVPRDTAVQLLTSLAWRGIAGFPLHGAEGHHGGPSGEGQKGCDPGGTPARGVRSRLHEARTGCRRCGLRWARNGASNRAHRQTIGGTQAVEVKIGVQHAPREISIESSQSAEEVEKAVADALSGGAAVLSLADEHGRKVLVPADKLAYVEIGEPAARKVGFGVAL
jgi:hypothetical protein